MAKKNVVRNDNQGSIHFDTRTKTVMAEVVQDNIKEKVNAVREVVPGKSNNEIILVLQYYDYNVEKAIQAYLEDDAKAALTEWHYSSKPATKKKKNKKKSPQRPLSESGSVTSLKVNGVVNGDSTEPYVNGDLDPEDVVRNVQSLNGDYPGPIIEKSQAAQQTYKEAPSVISSDTFMTQSPSSHIEEREPTPPPQRQQQQQYQLSHTNRQTAHSGSHPHSHGNRSRTSSTSSTGEKSATKKTAHSGLEKSVKDLHRQTVSLERLKLLLNSETDKAAKRIKFVFDELRNSLNNRENQLNAEMEEVRRTAGEIFQMRQKLAAELKMKTDRSEQMNEQQLADLRAEIKHFVTDRKIDEDLGRTTRFLYDSDHLIEEIKKFGEIVPIKCAYMMHDPSTSEVASTNQTETRKEPSPQPKRVSPKPSEKLNQLPHVDPKEAHEIADLQRRLKTSLQLTGIPVEMYPEPELTSVSPDQQINTTNSSRPSTVGSQRGGRGQNRRGRNFGRQDRWGGGGDRRGEGQGQIPPQNYPQGSDRGERVILIGRSTRNQNQSRPPRSGGRGRGGGGYRGRGGNSGRPRNPAANSRTNVESSQSQANNLTASE
ncbi:hypothetical protein CHS0354_009450 [Potamilus streckersoni]|uniref:Uncharacterized protein n=1 Tax=Potamilus streckersoni TaxID=2493646 RepID=A0AAE0TKG9_9BIVA|nr:hypothetical protein CHS0354_009450 [Potamilus streckersoni]